MILWRRYRQAFHSSAWLEDEKQQPKTKQEISAVYKEKSFPHEQVNLLEEIV